MTAVLIQIGRLLVRTRQVPSRADELIALHDRLRTEREADLGEDERVAAVELRALKARISATLAGVSSCASCAVGKRGPRGAFAGGDCCTGVTADLFSDEEVAALAAAGTRPGDLHPPRREHAGCAFRGEVGCTLKAEHRPERCVSYLCSVLRRELTSRGELLQIDEMIAELRRVMVRFSELRLTRLDDEILAPLEAAIRAHVAVK